MITFHLVLVEGILYRCRKVTPFWTKHLLLVTLEGYQLAQCCRNYSNSVYLIVFNFFLLRTINFTLINA